jgi:hypothetical protein
LCCFLAQFAALPALQAQQLPERSILETLGQQGWRALELARQRDRDTRLRQAPVYQGLWLRETDAADSSVFDFLPFASAPRRRSGTALAYDQGTGARMWSGFTDADPTRSAALGAAARGLLALWRLLPPIDGGPRDLLGPQRCPGARLRVGAETLFGFGTDGRDAPPESRTLIVYADCRRELGRGWEVGAGLRGYTWRTPGLDDRQDIESSVRLAHLPRGDGLLVLADGTWTPHYRRLVLHVERPVALGALRLRPFARVGWGQALPFSLGFWPGGFDGFPGLHTGERRGDREVTAALDLQRPIAGKLSLRALVATGRTATGGGLLSASRWLLGVRAGLNLDTSFGLIRLEYGVATGHRRALLLRAGRVF